MFADRIVNLCATAHLLPVNREEKFSALHPGPRQLAFSGLGGRSTKPGGSDSIAAASRHAAISVSAAYDTQPQAPTPQMEQMHAQ
jgi:hypothetical protein